MYLVLPGSVRCAAPGTFRALAGAVCTRLPGTAVRDGNPISYLNRTSEHFTGFTGPTAQAPNIKQ